MHEKSPPSSTLMPPRTKGTPQIRRIVVGALSTICVTGRRLVAQNTRTAGYAGNNRTALAPRMSRKTHAYATKALSTIEEESEEEMGHDEYEEAVDVLGMASDSEDEEDKMLEEEEGDGAEVEEDAGKAASSTRRPPGGGVGKRIVKGRSSGKGKGKGKGKGTYRRPVFKGVRTSSMRRLAKRAAIPSCRTIVHDVMHDVLDDFVSGITSDACALAAGAQRKTLRSKDITYALTHNGRTVLKQDEE